MDFLRSIVPVWCWIGRARGAENKRESERARETKRERESARSHRSLLGSVESENLRAPVKADAAKFTKLIQIHGQDLPACAAYRSCARENLINVAGRYHAASDP